MPVDCRKHTRSKAVGQKLIKLTHLVRFRYDICEKWMFSILHVGECRKHIEEPDWLLVEAHKTKQRDKGIIKLTLLVKRRARLFTTRASSLEGWRSICINIKSLHLNLSPTLWEDFRLHLGLPSTLSLTIWKAKAKICSMFAFGFFLKFWTFYWSIKSSFSFLFQKCKFFFKLEQNWHF